jgi:hypothetical protein
MFVDRSSIKDDLTQEPTQPQPTQSVWPMAILQFAKEYFVPLSTFAVVLGVLLATVFLYGYLSVFDWHLIWIVQYQDVLGFALMAVGVIAGFGALILTSVENVVLYSGLPQGQPKWVFISVSVGAFILAIGLSIHAEYKSPDPHYNHIINASLCFFMLVALAFVIGRAVHFRTWPNPWGIIWIFFLAIFGAYSFGQWLGYSILEERGTAYDVYMKNETLNGAHIVMATSHHMILYSDKTIYVVPTDEVNKVIEHK